MQNQNLATSLGIVILVVVALLGGVYLLTRMGTPQSEEMPEEATTNTAPSVPSVTAVWPTWSGAPFTIKYPPTYTVSSNSPSFGTSVLVSFQGQDSTGLPDEITIRELQKAPDGSFETTLLRDATYDGSGEHPLSMAEFQKRTFGNNTFWYFKGGVFEAQLSAVYYLQSGGSIYAISLRESGLTQWMEPSFNPEETQRHKDLKAMLATLKL